MFRSRGGQAQKLQPSGQCQEDLNSQTWKTQPWRQTERGLEKVMIGGCVFHPHVVKSREQCSRL